MPPSARPRDAASLLLLKPGTTGTAILMGRRPPASSFIPDAFVFPGGKVDPQDRQLACPFPLEAETLRGLRSGASVTAGTARALANAAIRETYEETGLLLARPADFRAPGPGTWREFERKALGPDHTALRMIGRAITPSASPVRYHARFFVASAADVRGSLAPTEELLDLAWYPVSEALGLPIIDVTRLLLEEIARLNPPGGESRLPPRPTRRAFIHYRAEKPTVEYENVGR
jgi:8-oxo-dGTP pyrophosphatase MutT (NUDIX family)